MLLAASLGQTPPGEAKPKPRNLEAAPREAPAFFVRTPTHPDVYLVAAIDAIRKVAEQDRPFMRFTMFNTAPDLLVDDSQTLSLCIQNTLNSSATLAPLYKTSNARLRMFDLRLTKWTVESFTASVREDRTLREPFIDSVLAEELRRLVGVQQDPATLHCDVIAPGMWFLREMLEPGGRTDTMYNLLYSEERFGPTAFAAYKQTASTGVTPETKKVKKVVEVPWEGGVWPEDGKFYAPRAFKVKREIEVEEPTGKIKEVPSLTLFVQQKVNTKVVKNFPGDLTDFQNRWQITDAQKSFDKLQILGKNGEIVTGSRNAAGVKGSIVAYNDRVIEVIVTAGGLPYMRTKDFKKTAGKRNPINDLQNTVFGEVVEDAGEHIFTLPCGMPTHLLTGPAGEGRKRVEAGDAELVSSSKDPKLVVVKNQVSCFFCHAADWGVIPPSNRKVFDTSRRGISVGVTDPVKTLGVRSFFLEWGEEEMDVWRLPYKRALRSLTGRPETGGWSGERLGQEVMRFRDWYDAPVSFNQAAAELGIPRVALLFVLLQEGGPESQILFTGGSVPRAEWDEELFPKLALIWVAARDARRPNPMIQWLFPELLK